jgi:hypothetical protein
MLVGAGHMGEVLIAVLAVSEGLGQHLAGAFQGGGHPDIFPTVPAQL